MRRRIIKNLRSAMVAATMTTAGVLACAPVTRAATPIVALAQNATPAASPINTSLAHAIAGDQQFIGLGDSDHGDLSISKFMAEESTVATLAASGVKHIFLEIPTPLQFAIDDLADGKISKEKYVSLMESNMVLTFSDKEEARKVFAYRADTISYAKEHGIKVHCIDSDRTINGETTDPELKALNDRVSSVIENAFRENHGLRLHVIAMSLQDQANWGEKTVADYISHLPESEQLHIAEIINKNFIAQRLAGDKSISAAIMQAAHGDKSIVFYGDLHQRDFKENLGSYKIVRLLGRDQEIVNSTMSLPNSDAFLSMDAPVELVAPKSADASGATVTKGVSTQLYRSHYRPAGMKL